MSTDADARDSAIGENKDSSDGVDNLLDLFHNALFVEFVLLNTAGVAQPRCVEDGNLGRCYAYSPRSYYLHTVMPFLLVNS